MFLLRRSKRTKMIFRYGKTSVKNTLLARNLNRTIAFNDHNSLLMYATVWEKIWSTDDTYYLTPVADFLTEDFDIFTYTSKKMWCHVKTMIIRLKLIRFLGLYLELTMRTLLDFSKRLFILNPYGFEPLYNLFFTFTRNRLYINLWSPTGRNYLSLSVGLFLKFFKNRRSFKKNKLIKLLMVKYVRKLFIITQIRDVNIHVKKTPTFFSELCKTLTSPLVAPFTNPFTGVIYNDMEVHLQKSLVNIRHLFFSRSKPYNFMKGPRKGRLKRKIMRRIIRTNRIPD
jgi:hypothetical protein